MTSTSKSLPARAKLNKRIGGVQWLNAQPALRRIAPKVRTQLRPRLLLVSGESDCYGRGQCVYWRRRCGMIHNFENVHWQMKGSVHISSVSPGGVCVGWLGQRLLMKGLEVHALKLFLQALQQPQTRDELVAHLAGVWSSETVTRVLSRFVESKLVYEVDSPSAVKPGASSNQELTKDEFWPLFQRHSGSMKKWREGYLRYRQTKISLMTRFSPPQGFLTGLQVQTVNVEELTDEQLTQDIADPFEIKVLLLMSGDSLTLKRLSRPLWMQRAPTIPILIDLNGFMIGPICNLPGLPCLECLVKRLQSNESTPDNPQDGRELREFDLQSVWPTTYWKSLDSVVHLELFKWRSEIALTHLLRGAILFDLFNHRTAREEVFSVPGCACSRVIPYDRRGAVDALT